MGSHGGRPQPEEAEDILSSLAEDEDEFWVQDGTFTIAPGGPPSAGTMEHSPRNMAGIALMQVRMSVLGSKTEQLVIGRGNIDS